MVSVFETNVESVEEAQVVLVELLKRYPGFRINFDLEDCDNILRVEGAEFSVDDIVSDMEKLGHICKELPY